MNLNHLAIFHAVALAGGVSAGANRLHITQSAVSKQLADFERHLGTTLFERLPRGVRLTEAGKLLLGYANRIFSLEKEAAQALGDLHALRRGRVAIGASRTIGGYLLPKVLAQFNRLHPEIELSLEVANTSIIQNMLIEGALDVGFSEGLARAEALSFSVFTEDELVLIAAPDDPLAQRAPLELGLLRELPLLMRELGSGTRAVAEQALAAHGIEPHVVMTLASTEAIKRTVAAGMGYAFVSGLAIETELDAGLLQVLPVAGLKLRRPLHQLLLNGSWISPPVGAFLHFLRVWNNQRGAPLLDATVAPDDTAPSSAHLRPNSATP
jgi:DNA-binding transcriptional LysR family regulator